MSGLLEVLVILWGSVKKPLEQNEEAQKYTFAKFGSVMSKYFQAFEVHELHGTVFIYIFLDKHYCKAVMFCFSGSAVCCSPHTTGLIHASSCRPNIQVSSTAFLFSFCLYSAVRFLHFLFKMFPSFFFQSGSPSCGVLSKLRRMDSGAGPSQYGLLLDCICSWNQTTDILELITDWLTEALPKQGVSHPPRGWI